MLNVGDYVNRFMGMTLNSFAFDRPVEWMNNWTLFFWAWWVALVAVCGPVHGAHFARAHHPPVCDGHPDYSLHLYPAVAVGVRQQRAVWIIHGDAAFARGDGPPERGYSLLAQYPAFTLARRWRPSPVCCFTLPPPTPARWCWNFTSKLKDINSDAPNWLRIFWSVAIGLLTLGMLMTNGISALQNTTVIMGLPFSFVIFFVMAGLYKSLKVEDYRRVSASRDTARARWASGSSELEEAPVAADELPGTRYTKLMMETVCYPAMEVAQELRLRGAAVELKSLPPEEGENLGHSICWCTWATSRTLSTRSGRSSTRCRALPIGRAAEIHLLPAGDLPAGGQSG